ncbi:hypothetical protein IPP92_00695 [Candidatus Saccharibacteria bacterium]|nr:MAG: hypothetical protein IPP92_00695 [Candidatus Saccharibacteria bacterium]
MDFMPQWPTWIVSGGWLIVLAMVACAIIATRINRTAGILLGALVFFAGFAWVAPVWLTFLFVILAVIGLITWLTQGGDKNYLSLGAIGALIISALLASNLAAGWPQWSNPLGWFNRDEPVVNLSVGPNSLIPDSAKCESKVYTAKSLVKVGPSGRLWADGVSTPFVATDNDGRLGETLDEVCGNTTLGDAYAQALVDPHATINGVPIVDRNLWLRDMLAKSQAKGLRAAWLTYRLGDDGKIITDANGKPVIYVTDEYSHYASMINTLLLGLENQGTKDGTSIVHWPLMALTADELPRASAVTDPKKQDGRPFLALTFTQKDGEACPFVLAINIQDKRPEYVGCEKAKVIAPARVTTVSKQAKAKTTVRRTVVHTCAERGMTGTYPLCTEPKKPGQDGGASGGNANPGTDESVAPTDAGQPPAVYTPPAVPAPPVVDTPPAPAPEQQAPKPDKPAQGVSCPPGLKDNGHGVCTT